MENIAGSDIPKSSLGMDILPILSEVLTAAAAPDLFSISELVFILPEFYFLRMSVYHSFPYFGVRKKIFYNVLETSYSLRIMRVGVGYQLHVGGEYLIEGAISEIYMLCVEFQKRAVIGATLGYFARVDYTHIVDMRENAYRITLYHLTKSAGIPANDVARRSDDVAYVCGNVEFEKIFERPRPRETVKSRQYEIEKLESIDTFTR